MSWVFAVLLVLVVGGVVVVLAGGGGSAAAAHDDRADPVLPTDRPLSGRDLRGVRLNTAVRGYRADEVDDLLARLARELDARDQQAEHEGGSAAEDAAQRAAQRPEVTDR